VWDIDAFLTAIEGSFKAAIDRRTGKFGDLHAAGYGSFSAEFRLQDGRFVLMELQVRTTHKE